METDWSHLQEDYERLGSFKAVAAEYRVAPETVSRKAKELGVSSKRRWRATNLDPDELRRLYEQGATAQQLAEQFASSVSTIYQRLWMAGTDMRPSGALGYKWGPEQYAKRAAATARGSFKGAQVERFRRLGRETPKTNSPQERLIHQALIRARLSFETQSRELRRYYPDVKLHQKPVLIEIDGWGHQMPRVVEFDRQRDAALIKAGYSVIRFTNDQVEEDPDECVRIVVEVFGLLAEENPVAVIRDHRGAAPASTAMSGEDIV